MSSSEVQTGDSSQQINEGNIAVPVVLLVRVGCRQITEIEGCSNTQDLAGSSFVIKFWNFLLVVAANKPLRKAHNMEPSAVGQLPPPPLGPLGPHLYTPDLNEAMARRPCCTQLSMALPHPFPSPFAIPLSHLISLGINTIKFSRPENANMMM